MDFNHLALVMISIGKAQEVREESPSWPTAIHRRRRITALTGLVSLD
jgi:hypothetical protein